MPGVVEGAIALIGTIATGAGPGAFVARVGATALLSTLTSELFGPKVPQGTGLSAQQVTTQGKLEYRKIVYGETLVSGPVVFDGSEGVGLQNLWYVIPLCQGESDSIQSVWLDNEEIPVADIDWTPGVGSGTGSGTGEVSTAKWIGENDTPAVHIWWRLGYANQPVLTPLGQAFPEITTNFRGRGITYLVIKMVRNADTAKIWEAGEPRNIAAVVRGRKVYDPRLDDTNGGVGSHRINDPSTWEWSDNPVLHVSDYLRNEMGVPA